MPASTGRRLAMILFTFLVSAVKLGDVVLMVMVPFWYQTAGGVVIGKKLSVLINMMPRITFGLSSE